MNFPYVAKKEAAQQLCCSINHLYLLNARGVIELVKVAGRTVVTRASLDRALADVKPFVPGARGPRRGARPQNSATL